MGLHLAKRIHRDSPQSCNFFPLNFPKGLPFKMAFELFFIRQCCILKLQLQFMSFSAQDTNKIGLFTREKRLKFRTKVLWTQHFFFWNLIRNLNSSFFEALCPNFFSIDSLFQVSVPHLSSTILTFIKVNNSTNCLFFTSHRLRL